MKPYTNLHYNPFPVRQLLKIGRVQEGQMRTALSRFKSKHGLMVDVKDTTPNHFSTTDFTVRIGNVKIHVECKRFKNRFNLFDWKWIGRPRFNKKGMKVLVHSGITKPLKDRLLEHNVKDLEIRYEEEKPGDNVDTILAWLEELYNAVYQELVYVSRCKKALIPTLPSLIHETPPLGG